MNMLTPEGATKLREVRDYILANPQHFDMRTWHCGSYMCIGGTIEFLEKQRDATYEDRFASTLYRGGMPAYEILGFNPHSSIGSPVYNLFFDWDEYHSRSTTIAARRINAFLQHYGYPINESVVVPEPEPELALV